MRIHRGYEKSSARRVNEEPSVKSWQEIVMPIGKEEMGYLHTYFGGMNASIC